MSTLMKMCAPSLTSTSNVMMKSQLYWYPKFKSTSIQPHTGDMVIPLSSSTKPRDSESTAATYPEEQAEQAVKALATVQKILDD